LCDEYNALQYRFDDAVEVLTDIAGQCDAWQAGGGTMSAGVYLALVGARVRALLSRLQEES